MSDGSVTHWIHELKQGNPDGAQAIWERYFSQLVQLARKRSRDAPFSVQDEEDVALSVLDRFCRAAETGRFPNLSDRNSMWRLLVRMTARKLVDRHRYQDRQRRTAKNASAISDQAIENVVGDTPDPEFAAMIAEELQSILDALRGEDLRKLLIGKMEGRTNEEMAQYLQCSVRTVERMMSGIRQTYLSINEHR